MTDLTIIFLSSFLIWFMFGGLLVLWIIDGRIKKEVVLHALSSSTVAWIFAQIVKSLIPSKRPFDLNGNSIMTLTVPTDNAFPSGHAALAFGLAVTVWLHNKKIGLVYLTAALVVGTARIIANVHFPVDIAGGAILGTITAFFIEKIHPSVKT